MLALIRETNNKNQIERAKQQILSMLNFLEKQLASNSYIAGDRLSIAEIVAGSLILWLPYLKVSLSNYPSVEHWSRQLMQRPAWQATQPNSQIIQNWLRRIKKLPKVRARQWQQQKKSASNNRL